MEADGAVLRRKLLAALRRQPARPPMQPAVQSCAKLDAAGVAAVDKIPVRLILAEAKLLGPVDALEDGAVPAHAVPPLDIALQLPQLSFLEQHIVRDERTGSRWSASHQLFVRAEILRLAPASGIKCRPPSRAERMGTNQHRIGVENEKMLGLDDLVAAQLEQLLKQPAGTVPLGRAVGDIFFRQGKHRIFVHEPPPMGGAGRLHRFRARRDDDNLADGVQRLAANGLDGMRQRPQVLLDCGDKHVDPGGGAGSGGMAGHIIISCAGSSLHGFATNICGRLPLRLGKRREEASASGTAGRQCWLTLSLPAMMKGQRAF
ncbi:hypothetical protein BN871_DS_00140 [Paenibacillus sp. P22]|nr:hypothetical protein BN871_DS_00140 [Paenibacillus sp. P22]